MDVKARLELTGEKNGAIPVLEDTEDPKARTVDDDDDDECSRSPSIDESAAAILRDCLNHCVAILRKTRENTKLARERFNSAVVDEPWQVAHGEGDPPLKMVDETGKSASDGDIQPCTRRRFLQWTCASLCVLLFVITVGVPIYYWTDKDTIQGLAECGDCHCSYADSDVQSCPEKPPTDFSEAFLESLLRIKPLNRLPRLDCDPYQSEECKSVFTDFQDAPDAVCAIHFLSENDGSSCDSYWMVPYENATMAQRAGAQVTHRGNCGLCSSLQDLVVYMRHQDLTTRGQECGVMGLTERENGVKCFQKLGMSEGCAAIWMANVQSTLHNCGGVCFLEDLLDEPYNGPAPTCKLSKCLQCDEDNSGDVFKAFAGRTRRRSGLVTAIARPCDTIAAEIRHGLPSMCTAV